VVDDENYKPAARFKLGDLVSCAYDLYQYYRHMLPPDEDDEGQYDVVGIVVEIEYAMYSEIFGYEILYVILCVDGKQRYFAEEELSLIR